MIHEILRQSLYPKEVVEVFPKLFLALLFQVSFTTELKEQEEFICWKENQQNQLAPIRCTIPVLSSLLATQSQARGPAGS